MDIHQGLLSAHPVHRSLVRAEGEAQRSTGRQSQCPPIASAAQRSLLSPEHDVVITNLANVDADIKLLSKNRE